MAKRTAAGSGTIRKRSDGLWEARFTYLDELGAKKRKSIYGKTQKECRQKLTAATKAVDEGGYREQERITLAKWMDTWLEEYCKNLKTTSRNTYKTRIENSIKPYIGDVQLSRLTNQQVQKLVNTLASGDEKAGTKPMKPKSVKCAHGVLHRALEQAVMANMIKNNPSDHISLPKVQKPTLTPLMDDAVPQFLEAMRGDPYEHLFTLALFSGMRRSELLALTWEDIDFDSGVIYVRKQLQYDTVGACYYFSDTTKNGKSRKVGVAHYVVGVLRQHRAQQSEWQLRAGELWSNDSGLVFTNEVGDHLKLQTVYKHFKRVVASIGIPDTRFHDLRHSFAIMSLQNGDDPKTVADALGHYSSAFTMDVYGDTSETMRKSSQDRMEEYIRNIKTSKG